MLLGAITLAVFAMFFVAFTLHRFVPVEGWKELADIGAEANVPTWWNATLLIMVAILTIVAAEVARGSGPAVRRAWWVVAAGATYASIDETVGLHERLAGPVESAGINVPTYAWILPGVVIAVAGAAVLAAVGVEAVNGWSRDRNWDTTYTIGTIIEEGVEMAACVYAAATIVDAFRWRRICSGLEVLAR